MKSTEEITLIAAINDCYLLVTNKNKSFPNVDFAAETIFYENKNLSIETILKAIKKGGLGYYGITKILTTQIMLIWIERERVLDFCSDEKNKDY